ncbi:30S ribosomal protein S17 [Candidatus Uhrbacteria bacterium]|nr:30S ribosomal protein S17 [Candidatus Uhrbacteria bacterium]
MEIIKRQLAGVVVSNKMMKTLVVKVDTLKTHAKYKKQFLSSKKYKAHDDYGNFQVGDKVVIEEMKPMSKEKRWRVLPKK